MYVDPKKYLTPVIFFGDVLTTWRACWHEFAGYFLGGQDSQEGVDMKKYAYMYAFACLCNVLQCVAVCCGVLQ